MTNGKVLKAGKDNSTNYTSCDILVSGDYYPNNDENDSRQLVIRYYHIVGIPFSVGDLVKQGDLIGVVDEQQVGTTGPHLHLDFCYTRNGGNDTYHLQLLEGKKKRQSELNAKQKVAIELWGSQEGNSAQWGRCWEVIATEATYMSQSSGGDSGGNINREVYENSKGTDDNAEAVNFYFEGTISNSFMGFSGPPKTIEELNYEECYKPLRRLLSSCKGEFGGWPFAAASYAKLYRATIIGNSYINNGSGVGVATTLEDWLSNAYSSRPGWMGTANTGNVTFSESDYDLAIAIYNNLKYPNIYGENLHSGTEEFKQAIIRAISGIPLFNGWVNYTWAATPVFAVLFNTTANIDEGLSGQPRGGVYLMYRGKTGSIDMFNSNVK